MIYSLLLIVLSPYTAFLPLIYVIYGIATGKYCVYKNPWNISLIALFLWSFIVGIINMSILSVLAAMAIILFLALSVYIENNVDSIEKVETIFKYLIKFSIFSSLFGLFEKLSFRYFHSKLWQHLLGIPSEVAAKHRIYSTFGNPNVTGAWMATMILICIYFVVKANSKERLYYCIAIILFLFTLYLTGSRGAEIGLILGIIVSYQFGSHKRSRIGFIAVVILIIYFTFTPFQIFNIPNMMYRDLNDSFSDRYSIWMGCIKMMKQKPITGWGLMGIFENSGHFLANGKVVVHGHNIWISITTTLGAVGLVIYLYLKFNIYRGIRILHINKCSITSLLVGIQAIVIGQGLVDFTIITPQSGILFIGSAAIILRLGKEYVKSETSEKVLRLHFINTK